jgi:hypothetical protein
MDRRCSYQKKYENIQKTIYECVNKMWETKIFKTKKQMEKFIDAHRDKIQWQEIFINNAYGIEYRKLRIIDIE